MLQVLKTKCENLMTFIPSNLNIHVNATNEDIQFSRLSIPKFLTHHINASVNHFIKNKKNSYAYIKNQVYLYTDPYEFIYLTWPVATHNNEHFTITLGPLICENMTIEKIRNIENEMKLSADNRFILEHFYDIVPYYERIQLAQIASFFLDYLSAEPHLPQIIREDNSKHIKEEVEEIENKFENFNFIEANFVQEAAVLHAIETGDVESMHKLMDKNRVVKIPQRYPSNPLRESKNLAITMNSICLRASLKGGLNKSIAHSISHNYAVSIEEQKSTKTVNALIDDIMITYVESVRKYALKNHSEIIINAINYIRTNLVKKISLHEIASYLHISDEHLSRQFKSEMGMTITDYIHKVKIEESSILLLSKAYSISDLSYMFGYSSPAHYTKMFKRFMEVSPKQWQKNELAKQI